MKRVLIITGLLLSYLQLCYGQATKVQAFEAFENLVGGTWAFEGSVSGDFTVYEQLSSGFTG